MSFPRKRESRKTFFFRTSLIWEILYISGEKGEGNSEGEGNSPLLINSGNLSIHIPASINTRNYDISYQSLLPNHQEQDYVGYAQYIHKYSKGMT